MPTGRNIQVRVIGDVSSYSKSLQHAQQQTKNFEKSIGGASRGTLAASGAFKSLGRSVAFASGTFLGAAGFTAVMKTSIGAASDLHEQLNKIDVVFGKSAKTVVAWSKTSADALGIAQDEALAFAGTFGNMLHPMGIARDESAKMSISLVKLAADMASFNNATPEDTLAALQSGLAGQVRPLREFGVFLDQARIKAEALADGIQKPTVATRELQIATEKYAIAAAKYSAALQAHGKDSIEAQQALVGLQKATDAVTKASEGHVGALTAAQKAMATYQIILKDTKDAHGDAARTSGDLAMQQRILHAQIRNTEAALGTALLPTVLKITHAMTNWLGKTENQEKIQHDLNAVVDTAGQVIHDLTPVVKGVADAFERFAKGVGGTKNAVELLGGAFVTWKLAGTLAAIGGAAGEAGAAGSVGLLARRLAILKAVGPIAIAIGVSYFLTKHKPKAVTAANNWMDTHNVLGQNVGDGGRTPSMPFGPQATVAPTPTWPGSGGVFGVAWSGDHGGLKSSFKLKLGEAVAEAGGSSINVTSGRRTRANNMGAQNSNHLTGSAADGTCTINGTVYPLGQAPIDYAKHGLRAGATFDWGGSPDIYHVDDGSNVNAGSPLPAGGGTQSGVTNQSAVVPTPKITVVPKKAPWVGATSATIISARGSIAATLKGLPSSLDPVEANAVAHIKAIRDSLHIHMTPAELAKDRVELAKWGKTLHTEITKNARAAAAAAAEAQKLFGRAMSLDDSHVLRDFDRAFSVKMKGFDTVTSRHLKEMATAFSRQLKDFDQETAKGLKALAAPTIAKTAQTAEEKALADFIAARKTTLDRAADDQRQADLAAAISGGDPAAIQAAQDAINTAALDSQQQALQDAADASRVAADAATAAQQLAADDKAAAATQAYTDDREAQRQTLQDKETDAEQAYQDHREAQKQALQDINDDQRFALQNNLDDWTSWLDAKTRTFQQFLDFVAGQGLPTGGMIDPFTPAPFAGPAGGTAAVPYRITAAAVKIRSLAKGGYVPHPTVAVIGDAPGGEYVIPAGAMRGGPDIIVHTHLIADGRELMSVVQKHAFRDLRGGGPGVPGR